MEGSTTHTRDFAQLKELIEDAKIGMLTTEDDDGTLRSRPLQTVGVDDAGVLWFFTSASSPKVAEAQTDGGRVNVSYANPAKYDFVSVSGRASLVRDREKMRQMWTKWIEAFFPKGLEDPDLALLRVEIEKAEYWDAPNSSVSRMYGLAKALATGEHDALGENRKIQL
jgi:general stress protein 26